MFILSWLIAALSATMFHKYAFTYKNDEFNTFIYIMIYFFGSPVLHWLCWYIYPEKPKFNFKSILSLIIYIISICVLLLKCF